MSTLLIPPNSMYFRLVMLLVPMALVTPLFAQNLLTNGNQIHQLLKSNGALPARGTTPDMSGLRVAIIDNGFEGFERYRKNLGRYVKLVDLGGKATPNTQNSKHGFGMAQIFMAASGALQLPEAMRPELLLLTANGYTEFKRAVEYCLGDSKNSPVDIIINSKNFDWGSDFKGGGFFNAVVGQATGAGIVWINAVGNTANTVYFSNETRVTSRGVVTLPGPENTILFENKFDDQDFKITLSWDDFDLDASYATKRDLDFNVLMVDEQNRRMTIVEGGRGNKRQIGRHVREGESGVSGNAFEEVKLRLSEQGLYAIRIYDRSGNFKLKDKFQLRVTSQNPAALNLIHKNKLNEVFAPADRADVIAVGISSIISAVGKPGGVAKPDVIIDLGRQDVQFTYSDSFTNGLDTSSATAIYGGIVANLMATDKNFSAKKLQNYLRSRGQGAWRWPL